ncbi:enoyl-CoA hydratase-related protein [Nocardia sp. NPDC049190]|uniref:enoyl-CoA hydratase-related protein n=1 Tax=Nocardia sp. NPDC049190 TaxID=3155650 RepID=UPI0033CEF8BF
MSDPDSAGSTAAPLPTPGFATVKDGAVLRVTITQPKRKNAIDYDTMLALGDAFHAAAEDSAVRVIVLTGEGGDFCSGADLSATARAARRGAVSARTW